MAFSITDLGLIYAYHPPMLLGHDMLKSGRPGSQWSCVGEDREQVDGLVREYLKFSGDRWVVCRPLYCVPSEAAEPFTKHLQPEPCRIPVAPIAPTT